VSASAAVLTRFMVVAQVCAGDKTFADYMGDFAFIKAISCQYAVGGSLLVAGGLVVGGVVSSIYIRTGSPVIPGILILLTGGAVLEVSPAPVIGLATLLVLLLGAGVITLGYRAFSR
jgi:hypothetical protein